MHVVAGVERCFWCRKRDERKALVSALARRIGRQRDVEDVAERDERRVQQRRRRVWRESADVDRRLLTPRKSMRESTSADRMPSEVASTVGSGGVRWSRRSTGSA